LVFVCSFLSFCPPPSHHLTCRPFCYKRYIIWNNRHIVSLR
jgi:hypothetical protein